MKKFILIASALLLGTFAYAQKGNIGFIYPTGGQKGTTIEVTVGGQNLSRATGIIISGKGVSGELIPMPKGKKPKRRKNKNIGEEDNLQLADQVKFRVTIDKDAAIGMRDVKLILPNGMTNRLYFEVGELPDVCESPKEALSGVSESLPVTFNGQIMRSDVDRFRFKAQRGQQLVLRVKGREFVPYMADAVPGWFQPIIRLYDPSGKEVTYNDDYTFHVDPVIFYKVPKSGYYEVEINDALYRGREDFVYRIDVGELPFITGISPIGGPAGKKQNVQLRGWNLKGKSLQIRPSKPGRMAITAQGKGGITSNTLYYQVESKPQLQTKKLAPNTTKEKAWALGYGEVVENTIATPLEQHWYLIDVTERKPVHFAVLARKLGAPTDIRMTIFDQNGDLVKDFDDVEDPDEPMMTHFADPEATIKLKQGRYYVRIIESQGKGGVDYAYRLTYEPSQPDFSLHIDPATFSVPSNGTGIFNVSVTRKQGFGGEVDIKVGGLPKGFKVAGGELRKGMKKTIISVTAPEGAEQGVVMPKVSGSATTANGSITRDAVPVEQMMQAFYYTHMMPMEEFRMEVGPKQPFRVFVEKDWTGDLRLSYEKPTPVKVRIERDPGFNSAVTIMIKSAGGGACKAEAQIIPEGENECTLELTTRQNKARIDRPNVVAVSGVLKPTSKRIAGKGRNAFVAAVTAYAPVFEVIIPAGQPQAAKGQRGGAKKGKKK